MKGLMDGTVRLVMLQLNCNPKLIPAGIKRQEEKPSTFVARTSRPATGERLLESVDNVGGLPLLADLAEQGYVLVDTLSQIRQRNNQEVGMVRYVFCDGNHATPSEEFIKLRPAAEASLRKLLTEGAWRTEGYLNNFFENGQAVEGTFAVSINMASRTPLIDSSGKPLMQWQKDAEGRRIGTAPVPAKPTVFLRILDGDIVFAS